MLTRLSRIHPYPAMIADDLARELSEEFIKTGDRVLDPFVGTGRTIVCGVERGSYSVGIDVNPLATLLTSAKLGRPDLRVLSTLESQVRQVPVDQRRLRGAHIGLGRQVPWFSRRAVEELSGLVAFINEGRLSKDNLRLVAAILSATAREVSYCRKDQWKLHRMQAAERRRYRRSPWAIFYRRLRDAVVELRAAPRLLGSYKVITGDSRELRTLLTRYGEHTEFDVVVTSPPYGDSISTVQYGGVSGICLAVLSHLRGLHRSAVPNSAAIDRACLGGALAAIREEAREVNMRPWWRGGAHNPARARVTSFLNDVRLSCEGMAGVLRGGGHAIVVVSRRSIGGRRLRLDEFVVEQLSRQGLDLINRRERRFVSKRLPFRIDRLARTGRPTSGGNQRRYVTTMRGESILVFRKQ